MNQEKFEQQMKVILATQVGCEMNDLAYKMSDLSDELDLLMTDETKSLADIYAYILKCVNNLLATVNMIAEDMNVTMEMIDETKEEE